MNDNNNRTLLQSAIDGVCILILAGIGLYAYYRVNANQVEAREIDRQVKIYQEQIIENEEKVSRIQGIAIGVIENRLTNHDNILADINKRITTIEISNILKSATQPSK